MVFLFCFSSVLFLGLICFFNAMFMVSLGIFCCFGFLDVCLYLVCVSFLGLLLFLGYGFVPVASTTGGFAPLALR